MVVETGQTQASSRELWLKIFKSGPGSQFLYKVPQVILWQPAQLRTAVQCVGNPSLFQLKQASFIFLSASHMENVYSINQNMTHLVGIFLFHQTKTMAKLATKFSFTYVCMCVFVFWERGKEKHRKKSHLLEILLPLTGISYIPSNNGATAESRTELRTRG